MYNQRIIRIVTALALFFVAASVQTHADDSIVASAPGVDSLTVLPDKKQNIFQRVIAYFDKANKSKLTKKPDFSFVLGPHYSSDTKFGIGLLAAGIYSTTPEDITVQPSNISIFADVTTGKFFKIGVCGLHLYRRGNRRVDYELSFNSYSTYFWGIGYDAARTEANKSKYLLLDVHVEADHLWKMHEGIYVGPQFDFDYISSRQPENPEIWNGLSRSTLSVGVGVQLQYDTRDNYTAPENGWMNTFSSVVYPRLPGKAGCWFGLTDVALSRYLRVWSGGVIASRLHGCFTYGRTPWGKMPTPGQNGTMRGYYEGQYRDKCEFDLTVEWRQRVWRRSGMVVWGGLGAVFHSFRNFRGRYLLPSYGIGYRWEFKKFTNIRIDLGFGKKCWGVEFNINEAF